MVIAATVQSERQVIGDGARGFGRKGVLVRESAIRPNRPQSGGSGVEIAGRVGGSEGTARRGHQGGVAACILWPGGRSAVPSGGAGRSDDADQYSEQGRAIAASPQGF